jgi:hypothetical protein
MLLSQTLLKLEARMLNVPPRSIRSQTTLLRGVGLVDLPLGPNLPQSLRCHWSSTANFGQNGVPHWVPC